MRRKGAVRLLATTLVAVPAVAIATWTAIVENDNSSPYPLAPTRAYTPLGSALDPTAAPVGAGKAIPLEVPFRPGETLGEVLSTLELEPGDATALVAELAKHADLRRLRPQDRYAAVQDPANGLQLFELTLEGKGRAAVARRPGGWESEWRPFVQRREVRRVVGELEGTLEGSLRSAGAEPGVAYRMADVLQWDLDFTRDLRIGDRFEVLYEVVYLDGAYHSLGDVRAMRYETRGSVLEAYRFGAGDRHGYYDGDGRPLRKMFLRSPMRYSRVTSRFSQRRFHPVLKKYRPHYGVDYGAPTGTPVRVTANGVVTSAGWSGGGGRTVKVRHPNGYVTAYLHLSRYANGVRTGARVSQGDVIGFVGSSGLATGPHLDYRIQKDGRWIDPLSLKSVPAEPVPESERPSYLVERDRLRRALSGVETYELPIDDRAEFAVAAVADISSRGS